MSVRNLRPEKKLGYETAVLKSINLTLKTYSLKGHKIGIVVIIIINSLGNGRLLRSMF